MLAVKLLGNRFHRIGKRIDQTLIGVQTAACVGGAHRDGFEIEETTMHFDSFP